MTVASPLPRDVAFDERTLPRLLARGAELFGERPMFECGSVGRSFEELPERVACLGGALRAAGVGAGDRVAIMCSNRPESLETWLACGWIGAVAAMVNIASRGRQLEHVLANSEPRLLVVDADLVPAVDDVPRPSSLTHAWIVAGEASDGLRGVSTTPFPERGDQVPPHPVRPGDPLAILYTSGTTGPSKGVCCPHAHLYWWAVITAEQLRITGEDVLYTTLPMFHIGPLNTFCQALLHGAKAHFGPRFSSSGYACELVETGATVSYLLGVMVEMLLKRPAGSQDRAHRARVALAPGTTARQFSLFQERFGIELVEGWGCTEVNYAIGAPAGTQVPGTMGRALAGFEARVVDEHDAEVPRGEPGELVVRHSEPFSVSTGYFRQPEDTVRSWRNLWFHTGDRVIQRRDGRFVFVDRIKEVIRRRGENIASYEVEQALLSHEAVRAAAAVPVPSDLGDDEVLAFVVAVDGRAVDPAELLAVCERDLPAFAVPRYLQVVSELPLTENGKVQKHLLRECGVTSSTWDRLAAGVRG